MPPVPILIVMARMRFMTMYALSDYFNMANKWSFYQNIHLREAEPDTYTDQILTSLQESRLVFIWGQETGVGWHPTHGECYQNRLTFLQCSINMWSDSGVAHTFTNLRRYLNVSNVDHTYKCVLMKIIALNLYTIYIRIKLLRHTLRSCTAFTGFQGLFKSSG